MNRPDSESWLSAKAAGDEAELAVAQWAQSLGWRVSKYLGLADADLELRADVEVKRDLAHERTGNVAVEVAYNDSPSGVNAENGATWWAIVLGSEMLLAKRRRLAALVSNRSERRAGDGGKARVVLLPVEELRKAAGVHRVLLREKGAA